MPHRILASRPEARPGSGVYLSIISGIVGGLGLFMFGLWVLTENLKTLAGRSLRRTVHRWTANPLTALLWGALAGTTTQSMSGLTFIVISVLRSRLLTIESALVVVLGGGFGVTMIVVVAAFDIRMAALCVIGLAAAVAVSERLARYRALATALFGCALMIFGLVLLKDAAAPMAEAPWFQDAMAGAGASLWLAFGIAVLLTFIAQSSGAVSIFAISLATAGAISMDQVLMMIYGSFIGSGAIQYVLSTGLTGRSRQLAMFMVLYNALICAIGVPWLLLEVHTGFPGLKALVTATNLEPAQQMSAFYIMLAVVLLPLLVPLRYRLAWFLERLWPVSRTDGMSGLAFIHGHASVDAETSLTLVDLEQWRLLTLLSQYFELVRRNRPIASTQAAILSIMGEIDEFLADLQTLHPTQGVERRNVLMSRQKLLAWLEVALADVCRPLTVPGGSPPFQQFRDTVCEGVDTAVLLTGDLFDEADPRFRNRFGQSLDVQIETIRGIRRRYAASRPALTGSELNTVTQVSNAVESVFFLLSKLADDVRS